jgi:hypothetical protein
MVEKNAAFAHVAPIVAELKKRHQLPQDAAAQIVCRVFDNKNMILIKQINIIKHSC